MKKTFAIILVFGFIFCINGSAFCGDEAPSNNAEGSIYAYSESNIPEIFFFPKEKARWDGTKVTMREWYMLTDLQKEKFVSEYLGELKKQYQGALEALGLDYLKALDIFSYYSNEKAQGQPSTKVIDLLLEGQNKTGTIFKK